MAFFTASSPHAHNRRSTPSLMMSVALCALPGLLAQSYFFGWGTLVQLVFAIVIALSLEGLVMLLRKRSPMSALRDNSALVTAWLLAVAIPPLAPWWIITLGLIFAIVIAKQLYGGLGQNPFNPAMVAYVVLLISFPIQMTSWSTPIALAGGALPFTDTLALIFGGQTLDGFSLQQVRAGIDGITMATPLDAFKTGIKNGATPHEILDSAIFDSMAGVGWQWVNAAYLLGGLALLKMRVIEWHIPIAFLVSLTLFSLVFQLFQPGSTAGTLVQLFSGATMLGAFFIATDPVSASTTVKGRLVFGALIGALVFVIRSWGGFPDGVAFAVLLANMTVPLIDYYTKPRTYGHKG
ncbi:electron transport complex subunit RsxD [Vibrio sp. SM6]|uniref:Ion-translocating oxidoreductase complex subunit D n=1 Tax=Vibrio agarilyticus TaxID=2726741 RepID=A0A7X8TSF8_9VIBR|nr:electron transport complex subunit RsxD [Vibrio agarilyticus]NLS13924.1 electron transport complex subunit RsxD [Vibrio agarilyticus]